MERLIHRACAWCGTVALVLVAVGFIVIAGFVPTHSPSDSAAETARLYLEDQDRIRWGLIVCMFAVALLLPYTVAISTQIRRIEGRHPALSMIQFGFGSILVLEFIYLIFFWLTAAFRVDRAPELVQLLDDMAWIPMVGLTGTAVLQVVCFGAAILMDRRATPLFPRWLGYYNLWVALMFTPGTFNVFFHDGPLAWNGVIAWYLPLVAFASWLVINPYFLARAVNSMDLDGPVRDDDAEIARLRADLDALTAGRVHD